MVRRQLLGSLVALVSAAVFSCEPVEDFPIGDDDDTTESSLWEYDNERIVFTAYDGSLNVIEKNGLIERLDLDGVMAVPGIAPPSLTDTGVLFQGEDGIYEFDFENGVSYLFEGGHPDFHDGRIVFCRDGDLMVFDNDVYSLDLEGCDPAWSLDGDKLVFKKEEKDLYVVGIDCSDKCVVSNLERLTENENFHVSTDPIFAPDGKIFYMQYEGDVDHNLMGNYFIDWNSPDVSLEELTPWQVYSYDGVHERLTDGDSDVSWLQVPSRGEDYDVLFLKTSFLRDEHPTEEQYFCAFSDLYILGEEEPLLSLGGEGNMWDCEYFGIFGHSPLFSTFDW